MASPYYAARAEGCRYWDPDGNEFLDFLCGYGPNVLGVRHPEVEAAADRQRALGECLNHPPPVMVDLAERLVSLVDFAAWAVFGKNGSDMTTWALQVARRAHRAQENPHGKRSLPRQPCLVHPRSRRADRGGLHAHPRFSVERSGGFRGPPAQTSRTGRGRFRDTPSIIPAFADLELPAPGFLQGVQAACRREGVVLILDDVRCGFRLHLGGLATGVWLRAGHLLLFQGHRQRPSRFPLPWVAKNSLRPPVRFS